MEVDLPEDIEIVLYQVLGNIPIRKLEVDTGLVYDYAASINAFLYHRAHYYNNSDIPYYIIDFNSNESFVLEGSVFRYNNYPHIVLKNSAIEAGIEIHEDMQEIINTIETLFNQIFTEITKEEYLEIHNQCIAGTWVPEW